MHAWAVQMGMDEAAKLLASILDQEKAADKKLTKIATARINYAASDE